MSRSASLLPREHGVYAELAFPIATALLLGGIGVASAAFAATIVLGVLIHEPFAVLAGRRGKRLQSQHAARAKTRVTVLTALIGATGVTALLSTSATARRAALVPLGLVIVLLPSVMAGREKTLWGELLVIGALSAGLMPVAVAGSLAWAAAAAASSVWFVSFALGTVTVHAVKSYHKSGAGNSWSLAAAPLLGLTAIGGGLIAASNALVVPAVVYALLPSALAATAISVLRVHPRNLRAVGWSLVAAYVVTLVVLVVVL